MTVAVTYNGCTTSAELHICTTEFCSRAGVKAHFVECIRRGKNVWDGVHHQNIVDHVQESIEPIGVIAPSRNESDRDTLCNTDSVLNI